MNTPAIRFDRWGHYPDRPARILRWAWTVYSGGRLVALVVWPDGSEEWAYPAWCAEV